MPARIAHALRASPGTLPDRALDRRGIVAVVAVVAVLFGIGAVSIWQSERNADALASAQVTRRERNATAALLLAAQDAETAQRGFLLTANPIYLEPLNQAERVYPDLLARVAAIPAIGARSTVLRDVVTAKFAELRQTVALAQRGDTASALVIVRTNAGSANMATIRAIVAQLGTTLDAQLLGEVAAISRGSRVMVAIDIAGLVLVLGLAGLIAVGVRDYLATLSDARARASAAYAALQRNNDQLDETVRNRTAMLTATNEELQRFAYIVSHDLRSPLVNIMGFTSELEQASHILSAYLMKSELPADLREAVTEDIPEALGFIKTSTAKMDRLINAILKLSREGRRVLTAERLDVAALLAGLAATLQHQADEKGATIEIGDMPPLVADHVAMEQVFGNVMDNALKYLKPGRPGRIRVAARPEGAAVRFEVSDNGRGIAARDYERVFELFRRAGDQSVPGEGIGLAHVRALVRRMGGTIDCTSELGVGTIFTVTLPAVATYSRETSA